MNTNQPPSTSDRASISLAEVVEVFRPQVEKIEQGFTSIRVALDALAEHLNAAPAHGEARRPSAGLAGGSPLPVRPVPDEPPLAAPVPLSAIADAAAAPQAAPIPTVGSVPASSPAATRVPPADAILPPMAQPIPAATASAVAAAQTAAGVAAPPAARPGSIPTSGAAGNWSQIIFGDQLKAISGLNALSGSLLAEVYANDTDAVGALGYLLAFRSADQERKPKLLKELGEAFYQWKPDGDLRLVEPLIQWVHAELDRAGVNNRIELVQRGDRFDMQRHNARERGVEVCGVSGWVVLRDNGKVYTKANVAVQ